MSNLFGYVSDQDESLKGGGAYAAFGLNTKVKGTEIEFNEDDQYIQFSYVFDNGATQNARFYAPDEEKYKGSTKQAMAAIVHIVKATGVTDEQLKTALDNSKPSDFNTWVRVVVSLVDEERFKNNPVDLFLEYQWSIKGEADRTYPQIPRNMKGGYFIMPSVEPKGGAWIEQTTWEDKNGKTMSGLRYVDADNNVHPLSRDKYFMESNKGKQQFEGQSSDDISQDSAPAPMNNFFNNMG